MKDLTVGASGKQIFSFTVPMLLGNLFQQLYQLADSIIVGRYLGKEALAAVGASFPVIFLMISLVVGISIGGTIIISQYFGAKQMHNVKKTIDTLYVFLFLCSIVITLIGMTFNKQLFELLNLPGDVLPKATAYLDVYFVGVIFFFAFNVLSAVLRGLGDSRTPLYFLIVSSLLNVLLDLFFVAILKLGIASVALATVIAHVVATVLAFIYVIKKHPIFKLNFRRIEFDSRVLWQCIRIGLPTGLQHSFVALGGMAILSIVNRFGTNAVAAYTIAIRIDFFAAMPAMNFATALSTFVGQNMGAGKTNRVKEGLRVTWGMNAMISFTISALALVFSEGIISQFTDDAAVIRIGADYLQIVSGFYILFSTMFVLNGVFRGAGDTLVPMFVTLFALWVIRVPATYLLSIHYQMGTDGIWWSMPSAWLIGMVFSVIYYITGRWKSKMVVNQEIVDTTHPNL